jgi:hypothetical protein
MFLKTVQQGLRNGDKAHSAHSPFVARYGDRFKGRGKNSCPFYFL